MNFFSRAVNLFLHLDKYLGAVIQNYGGWTYGLLFAVIFLETGLVITPILPGDSLLFAVGAFAAGGSLHLGWLLILLAIAAIAGDSMNYWIGYRAGPKIFFKDGHPLFNKEYLTRAQNFYEKHGKKTIIIARFLPIIRTFAPFVAGVGRMNYPIFALYNIIGGALWVSLFTLAGYFFGNLDIVRHNFSLVILAIIVVSLIPTVWEYFKQRNK